MRITGAGASSVDAVGAGSTRDERRVAELVRSTRQCTRPGKEARRHFESQDLVSGIGGANLRANESGKNQINA